MKAKGPEDIVPGPLNCLTVLLFLGITRTVELLPRGLEKSWNNNTSNDSSGQTR